LSDTILATGVSAHIHGGPKKLNLLFFNNFENEQIITMQHCASVVYVISVTFTVPHSYSDYPLSITLVI